MRRAALILIVSLQAAAAWAAPGQDVSYPQCGAQIPATAYTVVGVNGGLASRPNPCFALEYSKAAAPQLYVNSGNPGSVLAPAHNHGTWPINNRDLAGASTANPYGSCRTDDSAACAFMYGYRMAELDILDAVAGGAVDPSHRRWWIDVETFNSWETDSRDGQARNVADLEGMVAALESPHSALASAVPLAVTDYVGSPPSSIGLYSTDLQWQQITGGQVSASSDLIGWRSGKQEQSTRPMRRQRARTRRLPERTV